MSDTPVVVENISSPVQEESNSQEKQYSSIELKAIEQGWIPKEEFDGDESEFIAAPEFVRRGELFAKIEHQNKELKQVRSALNALKEHHSKVKELEYSRALQSLKDAKRQATLDGEHEKAMVLEDKIDAIKIEKEQVVSAVQQIEPGTEPSPEFASWLNKNSWYEGNPIMRAAADTLGRNYHAEGYSAEEVLNMVSKEIRKEFPHKFTRSEPKQTSVEGSSRGGLRANTFELSDTEKQVMEKFVRSGIMTREQYIKELKATRK